MKQDIELERQKEEFRKKYENYKKMFLDQKHEKDCKIKELLILKEENPPGELKEMKIKIENLKASQAKEYNGRKEKEQKLE